MTAPGETHGIWDFMRMLRLGVCDTPVHAEALPFVTVVCTRKLDNHSTVVSGFLPH